MPTEEIQNSAQKLDRDKNLEVALDNFVTPYIPFKDNAVLSDNSRKPSSAWIKMYYYFKYKEEEFLRFYHQRSKIETTFSMIKKKFGSNVKSKIFLTKIQEDSEDGRIFRDDFVSGGYENAETLIDDPKCKTISKNLLRAIFTNCHYPHKIFFELLECELL